MTVQSPIPDYARGARRDGRKPAPAQGVTTPPCSPPWGDPARDVRARRGAAARLYRSRASSWRRTLPACTGGSGRPAHADEAGAGAAGARRRRRHRLFGRRSSRIGLEVVAVETATNLAGRARELGVDVVEGPLERGYAKSAPYDQILIDGAIDHIPDAIVAQLADGGRLGTALIDRGVSRLIVGRKSGGAFGFLTVSDAGSPALPGFERPKTFTF